MKKEQLRAIFLYEYKLGHTAVEAIRNINRALGQGTVEINTMQDWFQKFQGGNESLKDKDPGCSAIDIDELKILVEADPRTMTQELAVKLNVNHQTVLNHVNQLGKAIKFNKWVPHKLNKSQKSHRYEMCSALLLRNNNDPFLDRIVTCDERWILYDNRQRSDPKQPLNPPQDLRKIMVTIWWSSAGLIHYNFLESDETITAEKYCREIDEMHRKLQRLRPALVNSKSPILLHANAQSHVEQPMLQKLNELGYETLPYPPYSPDLLPTDYHFFKHLDLFLQDAVFDNRDAVKNTFREFIDTRRLEFYVTGINSLVSRWQKCVDYYGCYFD